MVVLRVEPLVVMFWITSPTEVRPWAAMSSRFIVKIGCEVSTSARLMREPVTSMRSSSVVSVSEVAGAGSCANTAPVPAKAPTASAKVIASRSLVVLKVILSLHK